MSWRVAKSLDVLLAEVNALAPSRSKASDGTIGNQEHASRSSRHNPNAQGVVCARDITQDAPELDIHHLARLYVARIHATGKVHPCLEYIISDHQSASRTNGWQWVPYHGANPHEIEAHWAVGRGPDSEPTEPYDDTTPWDLAGLIDEEDDLDDTERKQLAELHYAVTQSVQPTLTYIVTQVSDGVDEKALAKELAPLLTAQVPHLSDADLTAVAKAVNDEAHKRSAG